jgi:pyruvate/2-oxoglutarate dehydrogenase complex dihydrolipoamide acyltransferase (E2) component
MLRWLVLILLLANAGFWAWRQGWLEPLHGTIGARPEGEREPERLARQVHPERVQLVNLAAGATARPAADGASAAAAAASAASATGSAAETACLEAGPFDAGALNAAQALVQVLLPAESIRVRALTAGSWWVAIGPFPEAELLPKKKEQLRRSKVPSEEARVSPASSPVLVLSRHDSREAAEVELKVWNGRGVITARVIDATAAVPHALRVAQADPKQQILLLALPSEKLGGHRFEPCLVETP